MSPGFWICWYFIAGVAVHIMFNRVDRRDGEPAEILPVIVLAWPLFAVFLVLHFLFNLPMRQLARSERALVKSEAGLRAQQQQRESIAASAQRIAALHRQLGIDPIFDPVVQGHLAGEVERQVVVRICRICGEQIVGDPEFSKRMLRLHTDEQHWPQAPSNLGR